jgi:hypothetical protein
MKIEYIPDGSKECPLILIHGPDVNAIISLRQACLNLANGKAEFFVVHDLPGIEREASCKLLAYVGRRDLGVLRMPEPGPFRWEVTATSWLNVEGLLEPFCRAQSKHRHQYLDDSSGMPVIISTDRSW